MTTPALLLRWRSFMNRTASTTRPPIRGRRPFPSRTATCASVAPGPVICIWRAGLTRRSAPIKTLPPKIPKTQEFELRLAESTSET